MERTGIGPVTSGLQGDSGESAEGGSDPEPPRLAGDSYEDASAPVGADPDESDRGVGQAWDAALGSLAIDDDPRLERGSSQVERRKPWVTGLGPSG